MVEEANDLAKSIGAECAYFSTSFGSPYASGFKFKESPTKGFKKLKNTTDGYAPRANTELDKRLEKWICGTVNLAQKLTGIDQFSSTDEGLMCNTVGLSIRGKTAYLETRGNPTKGGKRISDLEFEKATKEKSKK